MSRKNAPSSDLWSNLIVLLSSASTKTTKDEANALSISAWLLVLTGLTRDKIDSFWKVGLFSRFSSVNVLNSHSMISMFICP